MLLWEISRRLPNLCILLILRYLEMVIFFGGFHNVYPFLATSLPELPQLSQWSLYHFADFQRNCHRCISIFNSHFRCSLSSIRIKLAQMTEMFSTLSVTYSVFMVSYSQLFSFLKQTKFHSLTGCSQMFAFYFVA